MSDAIRMPASSLMLAASSTVLLVVGWLDPIRDGALADAFPTISVATWWIGASFVLMVCRSAVGLDQRAVISASLATAAAFVVVPVYSQAHPIVWVQVAAIAAMIWAQTASQWVDRRDGAVEAAIHGSILFGTLVGMVSAVAVTIAIVFNWSVLFPCFGPAGVVISVLAVALSSDVPLGSIGRVSDSHRRLPWPIGISMLGGQVAWLAYAAGWVTGTHAVELLVIIWLLGSIVSGIRFWSLADRDDFAHVFAIAVGSTIVTVILSFQSNVMSSLALASIVAAGWVVSRVGTQPSTSRSMTVASRILGCFVVIAGGWIIVEYIAAGFSSDASWTLLVGWAVAWVVAWRALCPDISLGGVRDPIEFPKPERTWLAVPDRELSALVTLAVFVETADQTIGWGVSTATTESFIWVRVAIYALVALSGVLRGSRRWAWTIGLATLVTTAGLAAALISHRFDASQSGRLASVTIVSGFVTALMAHWLPPAAWRWSPFLGTSIAVLSDHLTRAVERVAFTIATIGAGSAIAMMVSAAPSSSIHLIVVSVALSAWSIAILAESRDSSRLRHAAVTLALLTMGLWATVGASGEDHAALLITMRWLVAAVVSIPMLVFVFPKLIGETITVRWNDALRRGTRLAGAFATGSLMSMLALEATNRTADGIEGLPLALVIGVAVTLAVLSAMAAVVAMLSSPSSRRRVNMQLTDSQRAQLILAAQLIGGIAWLHVFLCRADWAFVGLRPYWPYTVMALSFLSVGMTELAHRRDDAVMSRTLTYTALYLPLIPVIGFWLSGSLDQFEWLFRGGAVRYDVLLAIGAAYYLGISALWKGIMPRVTAIVLGNAAWWVVLVQSPGWGFLSHPQLWLIPPAVCVLVATHHHRDRLQPAVASGIRYASTLLIYVSSTADMMLQQIGSSLAGPIVLIVIALVGMVAGVIFRVRPFLYLGAIFVFVGVTSMVWHAHLAFDAVWPWWVFGITTGICLLGGLMAIEKNKPKLRRYANQLATWQG